MDRRNFFSFLTDGSSFRSERDEDTLRPVITAGLEPYTPVLTLEDAYHLLRRMSFAPTLSLANQLVSKTAAQAVDLLLGDGKETPPAKPGAWVDVAQENPDNLDIISRGNVESTWRNNFLSLQKWWADLMVNDQAPSIEKLTLFWSGHFTSEFTYDLGFVPPQVLYRQNLLLRKFRLGDFKMFLEEVTIDSAMLTYLGGVLNVKGKPNENYGREMMELYSCGIGNYTEADVKNAAQVLTGWKAALYSDSPAKNGIFNSYFEPRDHDTQAKQFLGQTISARPDTNNTEFLVRAEEIRGIINILFNYRTDAIAGFIARKVYRYFVYSNPSASDAAVITEMMNIFKQNDFQLRPMIHALLSSAHFYDQANRGVQIKTPAEFVIGTARQLSLSLTAANIASSDASKGSMSGMEQTLMDPPNVAGWPGYRNWIGTKTFPQRLRFARDIIASMTDTQAQAFAKQFPNATDVVKLVDALSSYIFPVAISKARKDRYVSILLSGGQDYEWPNILNNTATCGVRIRALLVAMAKAPDFHLC